MKLDPCPWCKGPPVIYEWIEQSRVYSINTKTMKCEPDEYEMINIRCCKAEWEGQKEDAEVNWNWMNNWGLK